jgi:hypothetical protein
VVASAVAECGGGGRGRRGGAGRGGGGGGGAAASITRSDNFKGLATGLFA